MKSIEPLLASGVNVYGRLRPDQQRAIAVASALELIALNTQQAHSPGLLESELGSLSDYADKIQEALKVKG